MGNQPMDNQPTIIYIPAGSQKPVPIPGGGGICQIFIHSDNANAGHIKLYIPRGNDIGYHDIEYTEGDTSLEREIDVETLCMYNDAPIGYSPIGVAVELM